MGAEQGVEASNLGGRRRERSDDELVGLLAGPGGREALGELLRRNARLVERICRSVVDYTRLAVVQDAVGATFVAAVAGHRSFRGTTGGQFSAWLRTIARRESIRIQMKASAERPVGDVPGDLPGGVAAESGLIERGIVDCLDLLRPEFRQALVLWALCEPTLADLARDLSSDTDEVPASRVKVWLHRAREQVKECLRRKGLSRG